MENNQKVSNKTELQKAKEAGYTHLFTFFDGQLYCTAAPNKGYYPKNLKIVPNPCSIEEQIVYRIETTDGINGSAIIDTRDIQNDF